MIKSAWIDDRGIRFPLRGTSSSEETVVCGRAPRLDRDRPRTRYPTPATFGPEHSAFIQARIAPGAVAADAMMVPLCNEVFAIGRPAHKRFSRGTQRLSSIR
jgi:hypothetical protein